MVAILALLLDSNLDNNPDTLALLLDNSLVATLALLPLDNLVNNSLVATLALLPLDNPVNNTLVAILALSLLANNLAVILVHLPVNNNLAAIPALLLNSLAAILVLSSLRANLRANLAANLAATLALLLDSNNLVATQADTKRTSRLLHYPNAQYNPSSFKLHKVLITRASFVTFSSLH